MAEREDLRGEAPNRDDVEIAPGVKASAWLALRLGDAMSKDWRRAIRIVDRRIRTRYLDPVELLLRAEKHARYRWRFGFTILAVDCLLVETLEAFRLGLPNSVNGSKEMFRRFLTEQPRFKDHFDRPRAEAFYDFVRCGILHQAEVRGGWKVRAVGPLLTPQVRGFRVNRTEFHERLAAEFNDYKTELQDRTAVELRSNLRAKMDHICTAT